jgi:hypothetical protein
VTGAEAVRDRQGDRHRHHADTDRAKQTRAQRGTHTGVPHRDVRARHEHHQREADIGEQGERRVLGMQAVEARRAEGDPCDELTQHDRQVPLLGKREQRADDPDQRDQGEGGKGHRRVFTSYVANRQGMSVFSSTW